MPDATALARRHGLDVFLEDALAALMTGAHGHPDSIGAKPESRAEGPIMGPRTTHAPGSS
jgi:hypothetical protein